MGVITLRYGVFLWDLDGTLTDPKVGITLSVQYALKSLGFSSPEADCLEWVIGPPLKDSFRILLKSTDVDLLDQAVMLYRERYQEVGLYENVVYPGISDLLAKLKEQGGCHLLATAKPKVFAEKILQHFNLAAYFKVIMGSELDGRFVEKDALIAEVLKKAPAGSKTRVVMIGDRCYDVWGARTNQIQVISVGYGYGTMDELQKAGPDFIAPEVEDLARILLS